MESQSLSGKARQHPLSYNSITTTGKAYPPQQLSLRSLSIFLEPSFSCSRAPLPISGLKSWERHIFLITKNLLWTIFPGAVMHLHWTFSLPLTFLLCSAKHAEAMARRQGSCWTVPGRTHSASSHTLCSISPLHHSKRKIEWVASLRVYP